MILYGTYHHLYRGSEAIAGARGTSEPQYLASKLVFNHGIRFLILFHGDRERTTSQASQIWFPRWDGSVLTSGPYPQLRGESFLPGPVPLMGSPEPCCFHAVCQTLAKALRI